MSLIKAGRGIRVVLAAFLLCVLSGCGFHLRGNATLPSSMQRVHLSASGSADFQRNLARALQTSGVTVEDESGPGIAELNLPTAAFATESLTRGGYVRITEQAVRFNVTFDVVSAGGQIIVPRQTINMQRAYSFDAADAVGNANQVKQIERSLQDDMVQSILFRLQAAGKRGSTMPADASSTH